MARSSVRAVCATVSVLLAGSLRIQNDVEEPSMPINPEDLEGLELSRFMMLQEDTEVARRRKFNCTALPEACMPPFSCQLPLKATNKGKLPWATPDGHPDWHTWCENLPGHVEAALACYHGDLRGYGRIMHRVQSKLVLGAVPFLDAHYCFSHGHCDNEDIGPNMTIEAMEAYCDDKFGHRNWTTQSRLLLNPFDIRTNPFKGKIAWFSKKAEESFAMLACGQGNYHCDAIMCKQEYCNKDVWRKRYGDARPKAAKEAHGEDYPRNY